jgi:GAF domain-containing protein
MTTRETQLSETFVQLADSLVDDFDIVDLLTVLSDRCINLLDADAAGILLLDGRGTLHVLAASTEEVRLLELFQVQNDEGPCLECLRSGTPVVGGDVTTDQMWPRFAPMARAAGFKSVHAVPLRLRDSVIGALNLFLSDRVVLSPADQTVAQALADVATIALLQYQAAREAADVVAQLHEALNSRIAIEQAKGVLAERAGIDMDESFARLRRYARDHNAKLSEVALRLVDRTLPPEGLAALLAEPKAPRGHGP